MENNLDLRKVNTYPASAVKESKFRKHFSVFVVVVLLCVSFYGGFVYSRYKLTKTNQTASITESFLVESHDKEKPENVDFNLFWEAWNLMEDKYVDQAGLDREKMIYGAISGMIRAVGDPFSGFMNPEETNAFSNDMEGTFEGIGVEIGMKNDILTVIAPLEGTPAHNAGLRSGDKILKIENELTTDLTIDQAVARIRGEKGSEVTLTVLSNGVDDPKEIKIVRDTINVKSVNVEMKEDGIAIIKISRFGDDTTLEFSKAATQAITSRSRGIILDLRNNPGGYLESAIDISSKFVPKGKVVVSEESGDGSKKNFEARGGSILSDIPAVVLVNGGSASASEITAGALRDNLGVPLVGEKTFGKGSVQQLEKLSGGSSLRITVARWLTPNGEQIMDKGLDPNVHVELTQEDYNNDRDPQMDKALEVLKEKMR